MTTIEIPAATSPRAWLEIDRGALVHNAHTLRRLIPATVGSPGTELEFAL